MKSRRQETILKIIKEQDVETQEELTRLLAKAGFSSTQGTVSRDIRELKLTKVTGEDIHVSSKYRRVLSEGIMGMESAENILVIKTVPGMAMACGAAIDSISLKYVAGCIAGDDTIFCAVKQTGHIDEVMEELNTIILGK